jgi:hypothetical protein
MSPECPCVVEQYALALLVYVSGRLGGDVQRAEDIVPGAPSSPAATTHACTSRPVAGEGPGSVNCREAPEEIAVGLLTGADLDEPTGQHIATSPACAAEQASLRHVRSLRGLAR